MSDLVTPIVSNISAFDATTACTITFMVDGGDQVVKNEIEIVNNSTQVIAYSHIETTYELSQTVPANTLTNGIYYSVRFKTYDILNNESEWSDPQFFYCYTTPTLSFNISSGQILNVSDYDAILTYNQIQGEKLSNAFIEFYDSSNNLINRSGNLYSNFTPPVQFTYPLRNLENNKTYRLKATVTTVNNTVVTTGMVSFYVNYQTIHTEGELYLTLDSCNGFINVRSAPIINTGGNDVAYNPSTLTYTENGTMLDLTSIVAKIDKTDSYSRWVQWYNFLSISNAFLLRVWFRPARDGIKILELSNTDDSNYLRVTYNRGDVEDYLSIRTDNGTVIDSGLGLHCNGNTKVFLWLKIIGNTWEVQTEVIDDIETVLDWNNTNNNNILQNVTTDIRYGTTPYGTFTPSLPVYNALNGSFNSLIIGNGIFDELNLSLNINLPYTPIIPDSDTSAILFIHFNNSIANDAIGNYTKAILQRKDDSMLTPWNVAKVDIPSRGQAEIEFDDKFIPSGIQQNYSLIIYTGNIPSVSYTIQATPKWGRVFLFDKNTTFKLNYAVLYNSHVQNIQNGVLMPINSKYPIVIQNGNGNYRSGSLQFKVLGYKFDNNKILDRNSIVKQTDDILAFLTDGGIKCIKDYNGNVFICKVINSPQISYDGNWGNGITTISFDWVEQTKYNDYNDMVDFGLIDSIVA